MQFSKIDYQTLNARQQEIFNFQKVAAILADYGFNCIKLSDDWQGADFLADHINGSLTLKVQLKGRPGIFKKYLGRQLWLVFPIEADWYLVEHDRLVEIANTTTNWLNTSSWTERGEYHAGKPSAELKKHLFEFRL